MGNDTTSHDHIAIVDLNCENDDNRKGHEHDNRLCHQGSLASVKFLVLARFLGKLSLLHVALEMKLSISFFVEQRQRYPERLELGVAAKRRVLD